MLPNILSRLDFRCAIMNDINLIAKKKEIYQRTKEKVKVFKIISIIFLFLVLALSISIFLLKLNSPITSLKREEKMLPSNAGEIKQKIAKIDILNERLSRITDVLANRPDFQSVINYTIENSSNITMDSVSISKKNLSINLSSSSLNSLNMFINKMVELSSEKKIFGKIIMGGLTLDQKSQIYSVSLTADLL